MRKPTTEPIKPTTAPMLRSICADTITIVMGTAIKLMMEI